LAVAATLDFLAAVPAIEFLEFTPIVFLVFTRTELELTNIGAVSFLGLYALFLAWMILESTGVIETVRGI
jgi:cation:H+ antiporter